MALVDQIHALARKCAQMDKELAEMLAQVNVESLEKPYTAHIPNYSDIDISKLQDGAIVQTDEEIGEPEAVLADIEHSITGSRETVPSSYAVKAALNPIGAIIPSIFPQDSEYLHLLDGSLLTKVSHSALYDYAVSLASGYPSLFLTEANWQSSVTTYGVCGKFVLDTTNQTLRIPLMKGIIEGTTLPSQAGDLVEAGLPEISGTIPHNVRGMDTFSTTGSETNGPFTTTVTSSGSYGGSGTNYRSVDVKFNASKANSIYSNSNTVQPQTIKVLYYIVVK